MLLSTILAAALAEAQFSDIAGKTCGEVEGFSSCCVTGVVTFAASSDGRSGVVASPEDPNGFGVWFSGSLNGAVVSALEGADEVVPGHVLEIRGTVSKFGFAPGILAERISVLRSMPLPEAPRRELTELAHGVMDNRRVSLKGVLMEAWNIEPGDTLVRSRNVCMRLATPYGEFKARLPGSAEEWCGLVDGELRIEGVATSLFNQRGEFVGVQEEVASDGDVEVVAAPPAAADVPSVALGKLFSYSPSLPDMHRRRVRGVVTCVREGECIYVQDESAALKVGMASGSFKVGDVVEATGFPRMKGGKGMLAFSTGVKVVEAERPKPIEVCARELSGYPVRDDGTFENFEGRFVTIRGRLDAYGRLDDGRPAASLLHVSTPGWNDADVRIDGALPDDVMDCASARPTVVVCGILTMRDDADMHGVNQPIVVGREIVVDSPADVVLVRDSAYGRYRAMRALWFAGIIAGVLFAFAFIFIFVRQLKVRSELRRMNALNEERKRIAGDLHDTVEQELLAAKMLLNTLASFSHGCDEEVRETSAAVQGILMSAKNNIKETVFNLRCDEFFMRSPQDVLKGVASDMTRRGIARVRTAFRGLPGNLPRALFADIIFVIQEAVTNAVKHGHAKNIAIVSDPSPGGFTLRVVNDGQPFDAAGALGPESGHFGISGMRERARRSGFGFAIGVEGGRTTVRLEVRT